MPEKFNTEDIMKIINNEKSNRCKILPSLTFNGFSSISDTKPSTLSWMKEQCLDWETITAAAIICSRGANKPKEHPSLLIPVDDPRLVFTKILQAFGEKDVPSKIEATAIIGDNCKIDPSVYIGHYTVIGDNVVIGKNTNIRNHVVINSDTEIGENTLIKSHCVIGEKGYGFIHENGLPIAIPHIGGVSIGNNVEIGSFTTIVKGTLGLTIIKDHVKIDDHIHIAHNVEIDEAAMIVACAEISGSTKIGKRSWIAPNATIIDRITIGDDSIIGIGAVITKNVDSNVIMVGNPGKVLKKK